MRNIKIFFIMMISFFYVTLYSFNEEYMDQDKSFESFLKDFTEKIASKESQLNKAMWLLDTTGAADAADLSAALANEIRLLYSDEEIYEKLIHFSKKEIEEVLLKRQLEVLINEFKENMIPKSLLKEISEKDAVLAQTYTNFRAQIDDKKITENEIKDILKKEKDIDIRKKAWDASKEVGLALAPQIIELVKLRNKAARHMGYDNYFVMKLELQDVDKEALFATFADLENHTKDAYAKVLQEMQEQLSKNFQVPKEELGPWAWKDPFCQKDPLETEKINDIFKKQDILAIAKSFYEKMGFDVDDLIKRSDLYEREGKNQHAFCIDMDRKKDVRTLLNIKPDLAWMETLLHEFGHAVYDLSIDEDLPWLLRSHPHVLTTEAIAMLMARQAYSKPFLQEFCDVQDEELFQELKKGHKRNLLIFARFVFLMTDFENKLYEDPDQDLNLLWWNLFEKYYNLPKPENRKDKADWAAKNHIGLSPVYYYSYLLGEIFASTLQKELMKVTEDKIWKKTAAKVLKEKMFSAGNKYKWYKLIEHVTNSPLSFDAWLEECNQ